jgi:hypothetical protein
MVVGRRSAALQTDLARLASRLDELRVGNPPVELVERTLRLARNELSRPRRERWPCCGTPWSS